MSDIQEYYADLLIMQYRSKPKARADIMFIAGFRSGDDIILDVQNAFNLDDAIGVQLNVIGKYAGVLRAAYVNGRYIDLNDDDFRALIRLAFVKNNSGSSLAEIQQILFDFFPGQLYIIDYKNMIISFMLDSDVGSTDFVFMALFQDLLPSPMAVGVTSIVYAPDLNSFFGFRTYTAEGVRNNPFNTYDDYQMDWPWLSYQNTITI